MSTAEAEETYSVDEFIDSIESEIGEVPDESSNIMYENIGDGDIIVYDLEEESVWLQRNGKRKTKKGNKIKTYGNRSRIEILTDQEEWTYELNGEPEKKYVIQSDGRVHEMTDIVVDAMKNDGFSGIRVGDEK